ncbi:MAG TPA: DUF1697 domain-containing protein [Candidatus Saccharimonadales bacterium]|nr:DUF1697 domain-containing protein [Candidatus Saccharimonadales bacterium]
MATAQYVVFLRGINVGGKNIIKMADLKACLDDAGFDDVATYIQSGNILLTGPAADPETLAKKVSATLAKRFDYHVPVVLRSHKQMQETVAKAPKEFTHHPGTYRLDVIFLREPLTAAEAMKNISMKEGVDLATKGPGVVYFSRLEARVTSSHVSKIVAMPMYQNMTIRNWNTTTKILAMLDKRAEDAKAR